jgi:hypothetical protein
MNQPDIDQPGIDQRRKVMRQCRRRKRQVIDDLADPQTVIARLHQ